ncbi:MAG: hypothetical protein ORO03_04465, partial [Alphaproteobacteria bacterium]|nr:hypothetical protein [Alphaproteobacteria bacterium]
AMRPSTPQSTSKNDSLPTSEPSADGGASMGTEAGWKLPSGLQKAKTGKPKPKNGRKLKSGTSYRKKLPKEPRASYQNTRTKNLGSGVSGQKTLTTGEESETGLIKSGLHSVDSGEPS